MSRREATLSALGIFVAALVVRAWAARELTFPRPEDVAYYVGVARNLVEGRGLVSDAIWSYQTPPLSFPRPAFEVWLPLPSFLFAIPMTVFGPTFRAAQVASILIGGLVAVLAWRLAADVAAERRLPAGRARVVALGSGLTVAAYLPLVLASAEPDSTGPFAAIVLGAVLVMNRLRTADRGYAADVHGSASLRRREGGRRATRDLFLLGVLLGLGALTRNEAIWLGLTWAWLARTAAGGLNRTWVSLVAIPAAVAVLIFAPWAIRDWLAFGTPIPGQTLANALSLQGTDIFAWSDPPTLDRYLQAGVGTLAGLRITGLVHNLGVVLLLLGIPISAIGLVSLPWTASGRSLRPLILYSGVTFAVTTLLFPVSTTWGTFQHAAGATQVLVVIAAVLALDRIIERVGRVRAWTRPVAWLGPALTVSAALLLTVVILPAEGSSGRETEARIASVPTALDVAGVPLTSFAGPVITDTPIWFAEVTGHTAIELPDEDAASIVDLAAHFGAQLLVVRADNGGRWPEAADTAAPGSACLVPLPVALESTVVFRIACP